jgi:peptide/nickel transport system substrate-binding protein
MPELTDDHPMNDPFDGRRFFEDWSRRDFMKRTAGTAAYGLLFVGAVEILEACGSSATASPSAKVAQVIKVGAAQDQYVLSGPNASLGAYPLNANIFDTLTYLTADFKVVPLLAESWDFIAPNTWRFHLRPGVKFHDGQPLTAQAVKTGMFDRNAKRAGGSTIKAGPNSAVVVDDLTIDFTPTVTNLRVPEQLVHPQNAIIAPGSNLTDTPVGTGPFQFVQYMPKERIVVKANPHYWNGPPRLSSITFSFYPDASSRLLALEAGDIDFMIDVPKESASTLTGRGLVAEHSTVGAYQALYANIHTNGHNDILQDANVRKAVAYGIDHGQLVNNVLFGQATQDQTFVPPGVLSPYASTIQGFTYDATKAQSLLEQSGWTVGSDGIRSKAGRRLTLTLISGFPAATAQRPVPTFLQAGFKAIGIELNIVEVPDTATYDAHITNGDADLYLEIGNQNDASVGFLPVLVFYNGAGGGMYQKLFAPGPDFDAALAPVLTTSDPDAARKAVANAMHIAIDEVTSVIPLDGVFRIYGMKKTVQGVIPHPSFLSLRWEGVSLTG